MLRLAPTSLFPPVALICDTNTSLPDPFDEGATLYELHAPLHDLYAHLHGSQAPFREFYVHLYE